MKCSNCEQEGVEKLDALIVSRGFMGRAQVAVICRTCEQNVLTMKIVLSRKEAGNEFEFEGYLPVASAK